MPFGFSLWTTELSYQSMFGYICKQTKVKSQGITAAIPQPRGRACSKRHGNLEMPALRAEGEIRDECFWPERGKNRAIGHTAATGSYRKADSKLRGRAVPKAEGADHGDGVDGMKSW